jgi:hypothetical protein
MIEYEFLDSDSNAYKPNGTGVSTIVKKSFTLGGEQFSFEQKIVEKSFLPGASKVGDARVASRSIMFELDFAFDNDSDYNDFLNNLLFWLKKTVIIKDLTNEVQCRVAATEASAEFEDGSLKRSGTISMSFLMLDSFWFDLTATESVHELSSGTTNIAITNSGYLKTYPIFTIDVDTPCSQLDMFIVENKEGIQVIDSSLGTPALNEMIVNCVEGTLTIGDIDRTQSITDRTGYFPFPVGSSTLRVIAPVALDLTISYFRRYYT